MRKLIDLGSASEMTKGQYFVTQNVDGKVPCSIPNRPEPFQRKSNNLADRNDTLCFIG